MEDGAVVESLIHVLQKIFHCFRGFAKPEFDPDRPRDVFIKTTGFAGCAFSSGPAAEEKLCNIIEQLEMRTSNNVYFK